MKVVERLEQSVGTGREKWDVKFRWPSTSRFEVRHQVFTLGTAILTAVVEAKLRANVRD